VGPIAHAPAKAPPVLSYISVLTASDGPIRDKKSKNRRLVISRHWLASVALGRSWDGGIEQRNSDGYAPMGMSQIPEIDVSIIGNGEPAVTVIAIGNALFNAVGPRVRSLPITARR
jgi:hypothetical protein